MTQECSGIAGWARWLQIIMACRTHSVAVDRRLFTWPGMTADVKEYVATCQVSGVIIRPYLLGDPCLSIAACIGERVPWSWLV